MKDLFYIEIKKHRIPENTFEYPCESISRFHLTGRCICMYGKDYIWKKELEDIFRIKYPECKLIDNPENCTDLIILPSCFDANINTYQLYLDELLYYQDIVWTSIYSNENNLKNIIFILPQNADLYSTNYKMMADYATLCFSEGLSKRYIKSGIRTYTLLVNENLHIDKLQDTLIYCLSKNSNHLIGKTIKIND